MLRPWLASRWLALLAVAWGAMGCSNYDDYCQKVLACVNHNEADVEACMISNQAEADVADVNGCTDQYEAALACRDEKGSCSADMGYKSDDVCKPEDDRLNQCVN